MGVVAGCSACARRGLIKRRGSDDSTDSTKAGEQPRETLHESEQIRNATLYEAGQIRYANTKHSTMGPHGTHTTPIKAPATDKLHLYTRHGSHHHIRTI
jgi:hypothetical protein